MHFPVTLSGDCKQCGFAFKSIRKHLQFSPKCREKYASDFNPEKCGTENNPEYILSGPCKSCGKVFKSIRNHISKAPQCNNAYDPTDLKEASKLARRIWNKNYYAANSEKYIKYAKEHYKDNRDKHLSRKYKYEIENKDKLKAVRKWKLNHQE